jgi:methyl-accepting chemotaxis protein
MAWACHTRQGFAIVADVARKLAHRTSGATTEISTPVRTIQDEIQAAKPVMG